MQKTVESIQNQTFKSFEVHIVDGDSNQQTKDFLHTLKAPFFFTTEKDDGIYDAMNKGVKRSKGDWFLFLGAGDFFPKATILEQVHANIEEPFQLLFGNVNYVISFKNHKTYELFTSTFTSKLWLKNTLHHQSAFYHKSLFYNNTYNTSYKILADYDFNIRLFKQKIKAKPISIVVANCAPDGVSKNYTWKLYKEELLLKLRNSSVLFLPIFIKLVFLKFAYRSFINFKKSFKYLLIIL